MKYLRFSTQINVNFKEVYKAFDLALFKALKPPGVPLKVIRFDGCNKGDEIHLQIGINSKWVSIITENVQSDSECFFIDEGRLLPKPLSYWRHKHIIKNIDNSKCKIIDYIEFKCHGGKIIESLIFPFLWTQFSFRAPIYRRFFGNEK